MSETKKTVEETVSVPAPVTTDPSQAVSRAEVTTETTTVEKTEEN